MKIFSAIAIGLFLVQLISVIANLIFGTTAVHTGPYLLLLIIVMAAFGAIMLVNMYTDSDRATISAAYIKRHMFFLMIVLIALVVMYIKFSKYIPSLFGDAQAIGYGLQAIGK